MKGEWLADLLHGHTSQRRENDTVSSDYIVDCYPDTGGKRGQLMRLYTYNPILLRQRVEQTLAYFFRVEKYEIER